jgi:hypothetical protein
MSRFAKLAKLDRYDLQKFFARKNNTIQEFARIEHLVEAVASKATSGEISEAQIKKLRKALKRAGGVITFSKENDQFAEKSLYQILNGRRKRITPMVQELFDHLQL